MSQPPDMQAFNAALIEEFRANNGTVDREQFRGIPLMLLTTTGARSGRQRTVPLGYLADGPRRIVLWASALAKPTHPAWYLNLAADPQVTVELAGEDGTLLRATATAATATGAERERLLAAMRARFPEAAAHQDRTTREIPLVVVSY